MMRLFTRKKDRVFCVLEYWGEWYTVKGPDTRNKRIEIYRIERDDGLLSQIIVDRELAARSVNCSYRLDQIKAQIVLMSNHRREVR